MAAVPPIIDLQAEPKQDVYLAFAKSTCQKLDPHSVAAFYRRAEAQQRMVQQQIKNSTLPLRRKSTFNSPCLSLKLKQLETQRVQSQVQKMVNRPNDRKTPEIITLISDDEQKDEVPLSAKTSTIKSVGNNALNQGVTQKNTEKMIEESKMQAQTSQKYENKQRSFLSKFHASRILMLKGMFKRKKTIKTIKLKKNNRNRRVCIKKEQRVSSNLRNQCILSLQERKRLELCLLREMGPEILTGPQFQVEIQSFNLQSYELSEYLSSKREDLLMRLQGQN